uniref:Uncharacterized protein n=1 Tax=Oryza sativa subsp. japonica TaxID=39947 RepID=Q69KH1_ORYSJ|nr:hypothetical protein [Oryza sativa Japonica Group]
MRTYWRSFYACMHEVVRSATGGQFTMPSGMTRSDQSQMARLPNSQRHGHNEMTERKKHINKHTPSISTIDHLIRNLKRRVRLIAFFKPSTSLSSNTVICD